jgi:hypothetical protein
MNEQKRPYLKPELIQVALRPEEAVLANCKSHGLGIAQGNCGAQNCQTSGS